MCQPQNDRLKTLAREFRDGLMIDRDSVSRKNRNFAATAASWLTHEDVHGKTLMTRLQDAIYRPLHKDVSQSAIIEEFEHEPPSTWTFSRTYEATEVLAECESFQEMQEQVRELMIDDIECGYDEILDWLTDDGYNTLILCNHAIAVEDTVADQLQEEGLLGPLRVGYRLALERLVEAILLEILLQSYRCAQPDSWIVEIDSLPNSLQEARSIAWKLKPNGKAMTFAAAREYALEEFHAWCLNPQNEMHEDGRRLYGGWTDSLGNVWCGFSFDAMENETCDDDSDDADLVMQVIAAFLACAIRVSAANLEKCVREALRRGLALRWFSIVADVREFLSCMKQGEGGEMVEESLERASAHFST